MQTNPYLSAMLVRAYMRELLGEAEQRRLARPATGADARIEKPRSHARLGVAFGRLGRSGSRAPLAGQARVAGHTPVPVAQLRAQRPHPVPADHRTTPPSRVGVTFVISSIALFMAALDNLVVTTALPVIRQTLHASLGDLEWIVNAYTLTFAVLLVTGAALGDRFGRRRVFVAGLAVFTGGSAVAALSPNIEVLIAARAVQGLGGAIITPLSLTILSAAIPGERRAVALGAWGGIAGLAVAVGPVVGGAISQGLAWQWIFWLNVPIGLAVIPFAARKLDETFGRSQRLDLGGVALVSAGLFALVWALVRGNDVGWTSGEIAASLTAAVALIAAFLAWEGRAAAPMVPLRFFESRSFSAANAVALLMNFGVFGSVFLLAQFFQVVQHYSPLDAGLRTLAWTIMPIFTAPIAGVISGRTGSRALLVVGMTFQAAALAWLSVVMSPTVDYLQIVPPFALAGIGSGLVFAPIANVVLSAVAPAEEGQASGVNNAIRQLGGVFGVAVLASVFSANGSYLSGQAFVDGLVPALQLGAVIVAIGAAAALVIGGPVRSEVLHLETDPADAEIAA